MGEIWEKTERSGYLCGSSKLLLVVRSLVPGGRSLKLHLISRPLPFHLAQTLPLRIAADISFWEYIPVPSKVR